MCIDRPVCAETDYFPKMEPCNDLGLTRIVYEKVQPNVCRDDVEGSYKVIQFFEKYNKKLKD